MKTTIKSIEVVKKPKVNSHVEGEEWISDEEFAKRNEGWDGKFDYENALTELSSEEWFSDYPHYNIGNPPQ